MVRLLLTRLIGLIAVLLALSFLGDALVFLAPGDPAVLIAERQMGGQLPTPEYVAQLRAEFGWDQPPIIQYCVWLGQVVQGNLGFSIRTGKPILQEIQARLGRSLLLGGLTTSVVMIVGIPAGFLAAWRENSFWDHATRMFATLGVAIPNFWLAFVLILIFSMYLNWLPTHGIGSLRHLVLPIACLGFNDTARLSRLARSEFLGVQHEEYLLAARAKGLTRRMALIRHGFANIAVTLVALIATQFGSIVAGVFVVETIFSWPGIGQYFVMAVQYRDIPAIQACFLLFGMIFSLVNALADIIFMAIDPRIRP